MQTKQKTDALDYAPWVVVAILAYLLVVKPVEPPGPTPPPGPKIVTVEEAARRLLTKTQTGYKSVFTNAAQRVETGEVKTEEQLNTLLKKELQDVRDDASKDLDAAFNVNLPTTIDDGNRGAVATFLKRVATGF
jgi:hypothetical protein